MLICLVCPSIHILTLPRLLSRGLHRSENQADPSTHNLDNTNTGKCIVSCWSKFVFTRQFHFMGRFRLTYQGDVKSLPRPGKKQARKHVRDASDFNNIEMRAVIKFFFFFSARQGAEGNSHHSDRNISLFPSWSG